MKTLLFRSVFCLWDSNLDQFCRMAHICKKLYLIYKVIFYLLFYFFNWSSLTHLTCLPLFVYFSLFFPYWIVVFPSDVFDRASSPLSRFMLTYIYKLCFASFTASSSKLFCAKALKSKIKHFWTFSFSLVLTLFIFLLCVAAKNEIMFFLF